MKPPDYGQRNVYDEEVTEDADGTHDNAIEIGGDSALVRIISDVPRNAWFRDTEDCIANNLGQTLPSDDGKGNGNHDLCLKVDNE